MLYVILSIYAFILIGFVLVYFFIIYHLVKYSIKSDLNRIVLPLFIIVSTLLLFSNILLFFSVNWNGLLAGLFPAL